MLAPTRAMVLPSWPVRGKFSVVGGPPVGTGTSVVAGTVAVLYGSTWAVTAPNAIVVSSPATAATVAMPFMCVVTM
ncbi:MAG: hypothetical protein V3R84_04975 [Acidimicrobiia bacterium]